MSMSKLSSGFEVRGLAHPTAVVADRKATARLFERVFNNKGFAQEVAMASPELKDRSSVRDDYPMGYSWYFVIADIFFDVIQPDLYTPVGWVAPQVEFQDGLVELAMQIGGMNSLHTDVLVPRGFRSIDGLRCPVSPDKAADSLAAPDPETDQMGKLIWTLPEDTGLSWELIGSANLRALNTEFIWPGEPSPVDPLSIERASHHTILTRDLNRALRMPVDVLGGSIIHRAYNPLLQTESTYVWLPALGPVPNVPVAPLLLEIAVPNSQDSPASKELSRGTKPSLLGLPSEDRYHMLTWKVSDISKVVDHLRNVGIRFEATSKTTVVTDPADFFGVRWGFTSEFLPGDPRA